VLDFSKATRRRKFYLPSGVKFLFLFLPWVFVAYGLVVLQEFLAFYNNSVEATARVVFVEASANVLTSIGARELMDTVGNWPIPAFLYQHENGMFYVGDAIAGGGSWRFHHGELVDIRYSRLDPSHAQPVTILKFWWTPGIFIVGGLLAFFSMLIAFFKAENPHARILPRLTKEKGSLNLRRK